MKPWLRDVTLVMVETREHALAKIAVDDCCRKVSFADVVIVTDKPALFERQASYKVVEDWPTKLGWSRSWWYDVPPLVHTSHTLNIQWDSWIWDASMWRDEFLKFDYVGAPWWYNDGKNVGNGGFSLVSTRLKRYLADHRDAFPCDSPVDDDLLCRKYRPRLEAVGFAWAPEKVAYDFAYEGCGPPGHANTGDPTKHFGFHAMFNWGHVLEGKALAERLELAAASPYIRDGYMMKAFLDKNPGIVTELLGRAKLEAAE